MYVRRRYPFLKQCFCKFFVDNYQRDAGCTAATDSAAAASNKIKWLDFVEKNEKEILNVIKQILESTSLLRSHFSLGKQLKHVKRMIKVLT